MLLLKRPESGWESGWGIWLGSGWEDPRLSCSAAATRTGYSWLDCGIYITGQCKSIYILKIMVLKLLKIHTTSIPLYKNAFEMIVILFGP